MYIILPHDHYDADHLAAVKAEMQVRGAPVIKAVSLDGDALYAALEGAHRIRAAHALGLTPVIDVIEWSDTATTDEVVPGSYEDTWTIKQICDDAHTRQSLRFA